VLLVDTQKAERTLNAVPWVESAHVETFFPHRVVIDVRERVPVATFRGGDGRYRVIDAAGRVLDVIDNRPLASMLITGTHPDTARGDFAGGPYAVAGQLVVALPSEIRQITQSVGVDAASGTLSMVLQGGVQVRLGDGTALDLKLARLLQQVRQGLKGVTALDVSTSEVGRVGG
jgi:cell division septal protein FtsQ